MRVLKLKKLGSRSPSTGKTGDAERRFLDGLKELRAVTTIDEYRRAAEAGVQFSIDGFRKRVSIGNQSMRTTHLELFDELKSVLVFIHGEVLGVNKNTRGRSKRPRSVDQESEAKLRVKNLEALLDRRERDFLDVLDELRLLRSQA
jgi:hypothetical protein